MVIRRLIKNKTHSKTNTGPSGLCCTARPAWKPDQCVLCMRQSTQQTPRGVASTDTHFCDTASADRLIDSRLSGIQKVSMITPSPECDFTGSQQVGTTCQNLRQCFLRKEQPNGCEMPRSHITDSIHQRSTSQFGDERSELAKTNPSSVATWRHPSIDQTQHAANGEPSDSGKADESNIQRFTDETPHKQRQPASV